jgi:hypothetical protein
MSAPLESAPTVTCGACKRSVGDAYYSVGQSIFCASCKTGIELQKPVEPTPAVVARAALFGLGGAAAGAALYYVVLAALGHKIALVAFAVAYFVGRSVHLGARGQQGRPFQIVAAVLTFAGIAGGYAPEIVAHGGAGAPAVVTIVLIFGLAWPGWAWRGR